MTGLREILANFLGGDCVTVAPWAGAGRDLRRGPIVCRLLAEGRAEYFSLGGVENSSPRFTSIYSIHRYA